MTAAPWPATDVDVQAVNAGADAIRAHVAKYSTDLAPTLFNQDYESWARVAIYASRAVYAAPVTDRAESAAIMRLAADLGSDPQVVVCCGPSRFADTIVRVQREPALAGHVVVDYSVPLPGEPDLTDVQVANLVARHDRAIHLADVVAVVNPGGYTGKSTQQEIALADNLGKRVVWLVEP